MKYKIPLEQLIFPLLITLFLSVVMTIGLTHLIWYWTEPQDNIVDLCQNEKTYTKAELLKEAEKIEKFAIWRGKDFSITVDNLEFMLEQLDMPVEERTNFEKTTRIIDTLKQKGIVN